MVFPWSKNERTELDPAAASDRPEGPSEIGELIAALGHVGQLVASANEKILAGLASREPPAAAGASPADASTARIQAVEAGLASLREQVAGVAEAIRRLQDQLDRGLERLAEVLAPSAAAGEPEPVSSSGWEKAVLGSDMAGQPGLTFQRNQLLNGVLEGNAAACALAGQLLVFQSAPAERLPPVLKEIGEAYYRWQPKTRPGNSPFEESLSGWLQRTCEAAGLHNTIELVHPGERFDATRHNASTRGVEITEVHGWIVLRDNGKVYTKANVTVR
jgi:hypothetical protein